MSSNPFETLAGRVISSNLYLWVGGAGLVYGVQELMLLWTQWSMPSISPAYLLVAALVTALIVSAAQWLYLKNRDQAKPLASPGNVLAIADNFKRYVLTYPLIGAFAGANVGLAYGFLSYLDNTHLLNIQLDPTAYIIHGVMIAAVVGVVCGLLYGAFINARLGTDVKLVREIKLKEATLTEEPRHLTDTLKSYLSEFPWVVKTLTVTLTAATIMTAGYLLMPAALPPYHGILLPGLPLGLHHIHPLLSGLIWGTAVGMVYLLVKALLKRGTQDLKPLIELHRTQANIIKIRSERKALTGMTLDCGLATSLGALSLITATYLYSTLSLQTPWLSVPLSHLAYAAIIGGIAGVAMMFFKTLLQPNSRHTLLQAIRLKLSKAADDPELTKAQLIGIANTYGRSFVTACMLHSDRYRPIHALPIPRPGQATVVPPQGELGRTSPGVGGAMPQHPDSGASETAPGVAPEEPSTP